MERAEHLSDGLLSRSAPGLAAGGALGLQVEVVGLLVYGDLSLRGDEAREIDREPVGVL